MTKAGPEYLRSGCVSADSSIDSLLSRNTRIVIFRARGLFFLPVRPFCFHAVAPWRGIDLVRARSVFAYTRMRDALLSRFDPNNSVRTFDSSRIVSSWREPALRPEKNGLRDIFQSPSRPRPTVFLNPRGLSSPSSSRSPAPFLRSLLLSPSFVRATSISISSHRAVSRVPRITVTIAYLVAFHGSHEIAEASTADATEY